MKVTGSCTKCGVECYEVLKRRPVTRTPLRLGASLENARNVTFVLLDGNTMDLTLCDTCSGSLSTADFRPLWQSCMEAWVAQAPEGAKHPWIQSQANNGIVGLLHARRPEK